MPKRGSRSLGRRRGRAGKEKKRGPSEVSEPQTRFFNTDVLPGGSRRQAAPGTEPSSQFDAPARPVPPSESGSADGPAGAPVPPPSSPPARHPGEPAPPRSIPPSAPEVSVPATAEPRSARGRHRTPERTVIPRRRRQLGPRRKARRGARWAWRKKIASRAGIASVAVVVAVAALVFAWAKAGDDDERRTGVVGRGAPAAATTTLVVGQRGDSASWLTLVSYDPSSDSGGVVYIPANTATEIPGRGLQGVGTALQGDDPSLLVSALENLLGIKIDHYLVTNELNAEVLLSELAPVTVDVPDEVRVSEGVGTTRLVFPSGEQQLTGPALVDLLYIVGLDGDDVELGARHLAFWDALLDKYRVEPGGLAEAMRSAGRLIGTSDVPLPATVQLFERLASLDEADITLTILPVRQVSVGGSELYATDAEEIAEFMTQALPGVPPSAGDIRVEIRNGNGAPGIGQEVAQLLEGEGFRIVLSGNAPHFHYRVTKIVTYDSSPEGQATAERARRLLGLGTVFVSPQEQDRVDLTIVVGKDFLRKP